QMTYQNDMRWCDSHVYRRPARLGRVAPMSTPLPATHDPATAPRTRRAQTAGAFRMRLAGLALCAAAGIAATFAGVFLPGVSPLLIAIVMGIVVGNLVPLPQSTAPGITYSAKTVLRAGIVLLGLQVVLGDIVGLGAGMIAVVVAIVRLVFLGTIVIGIALCVLRVLIIIVTLGIYIC